jgi:hypothetical protein
VSKLVRDNITFFLWIITGSIWVIGGAVTKDAVLMGVGVIIWCIVSTKTITPQ